MIDITFVEFALYVVILFFGVSLILAIISESL